PDFVLAFLAPGSHLTETLDTIQDRWPESLLFGCEAVTQFAGDGLARDGTLHLFHMDDPAQRPELHVIEATSDKALEKDQIERVADELRGATGALLICDGLRFPANQLLAGIRELLGPDAPVIAGGLASQSEPIDRPGARVFSGTRIYESAALIVGFRNIRPEVAIVRGWRPASPVFTVTKAEGNVVYEIDRKPAAEWYRQFFEIDGEIAPMPMSAHRFPLIIEGPRPERDGLYRSMKFFNDPPGAVSYWGEIEEGDNVRLGMGDGGSLLEGAADLDTAEDAEAGILFSCVGREMVLGESAAREIETIHRALGVPLSGFFSFAEIGPSSKGALAFYNQTAVLVLLRETAT
ncbi:MAG: FIST N-terminal domain-containing protein, partial [Thermoanaerobaculia bacterium]|nr:FIST N-terminal domain-containing protein [Thermoanaerobaculia bacterium]